MEVDLQGVIDLLLVDDIAARVRDHARSPLTGRLRGARRNRGVDVRATGQRMPPARPPAVRASTRL